MKKIIIVSIICFTLYKSLVFIYYNSGFYLNSMEHYLNNDSTIKSLLLVDAGIDYQYRGNAKKAIEAFSLAIEIDSLNDKAFAERGYSNYSLLNDSLAKEDFSKALSINEFCGSAVFYLGELYMELGQSENAIEQFTKRIELDTLISDPSDEVIASIFNRALCYGTLFDLESACEDFKKAKMLGDDQAARYFEVNNCSDQ